MYKTVNNSMCNIFYSYLMILKASHIFQMVNVENVKNNHLPSFGLDMMQVMLTTMRNNEEIQYF